MPDVAESDNGNTAEGVFGLAVFAEGDTNSIEEVGPDHRDFIKVDELEGVHETRFGMTTSEEGDFGGFGIHGAEGEIEKAMNGLTPGIEGGDPGGGDGDTFEFESVAEVAQEGGFSGSRASGDEDESASES